MLYIDGKRLVPAPFISLNQNINFSDDGQPLSHTYAIQLRGTLLPNMGSPYSTGWVTTDSTPPTETFATEAEKHDALLRKQELLRKLFSQQGAELKYYAQGEDAVNCNVNLRGLSFEPDPWVIKTNYTIDLETNNLFKDGTDNESPYIALDATGLFLQSASDTWQIGERDTGDGVYEISRNVSAASIASYGSGNILMVSGISEPWQNARTWVEARLAITGLAPDHFNLSGGQRYNLVEEESIDKTAGSYSVSQRYLYHNQSYTETRTVSRNIQYSRINDHSPAVISVNINGRIQGMHPTNDPSGKLVAAYSYWNTLESIIAAISNVDGQPLSKNLTEDHAAGALDYSLEYVNTSGSYTYALSYDTSYQISNNGEPSVSINGQIRGFDPEGDPNTAWQYAITGWNLVVTGIRLLAFTDATYLYPTLSSGNYSIEPVSKSTKLDHTNGGVDFSYVYGLNTNGNSYYLDTYTIDFNTENPIDVISAGNPIRASIQGTIQGTTTDEDVSSRYNNAVSGWDIVQALLYTRVNADVARIGTTNLTISPRPLTKSVTTNRTAGVINYSADFSTDGNLVPTGIANLDMTIDESLSADKFAIQIIPGRSIGPIIQDINTISERKRTINIAMTMYPNNGGAWYYQNISTPRGIANGLISSGLYDLAPHKTVTGYYIDSDSDSWNWKAGLYTRTYSVVYVPSGN